MPGTRGFAAINERSVPDISTVGCSKPTPSLRGGERMRILHVSWGVPARHLRRPRSACSRARRGGGACWSRRVGAHSTAPGTPAAETVNGVHLICVPRHCLTYRENLVPLSRWVEGLDSSMADVAARVVSDTQLDVVHAHDWVVTATAQAARTAGDAPLVSTFHATEAGRHQGGYPATSRTTSTRLNTNSPTCPSESSPVPPRCVVT